MIIYKYLLAVLLSCFLILSPAFAGDKSIAQIQHQILSDENLGVISVKIHDELVLSEGKILIPNDSMVYAYVLDTQDPKRWHKSAFAICKLIGFKSLNNDENNFISLDDDDIYMIARKYEPVDKKEASITAVELTAATAASFIIPGIDIAYFFTKGVIKKESGKTRFKSGVSSAYQNSIFWFWLKGKPLALDDNSSISFSQISKKRALKLINKIDKKNSKIKESTSDINNSDENLSE